MQVERIKPENVRCLWLTSVFPFVRVVFLATSSTRVWPPPCLSSWLIYANESPSCGLRSAPTTITTSEAAGWEVSRLKNELTRKLYQTFFKDVTEEEEEEEGRMFSLTDLSLLILGGRTLLKQTYMKSKWFSLFRKEVMWRRDAAVALSLILLFYLIFFFFCHFFFFAIFCWLKNASKTNLHIAAIFLHGDDLEPVSLCCCCTSLWW